MLLQSILLEDKVAEIYVSYSHPIPSKKRIAMTTPNTVVEVLRYAWDDRTIELYESFKVILLNRNNRLLGVCSIAEGGITNTVVDVRILFAVALKCSAVTIILAHNHPSGNINPSEGDRLITKKIVEGASILDIEVLDHVIITKDDFYSFRQHDIMPLALKVNSNQINSNDY